MTYKSTVMAKVIIVLVLETKRIKSLSRIMSGHSVESNMV